MRNISERLADVRRRIAETETRIAVEEERIRTGTGGEIANAAFQRYSAVSALRELRAYEARLQDLGALRR